MSICKLVLEYIDLYEQDEPIFIEDIRKYVIEKANNADKEKLIKNINVILNRLKKDNIIRAEYKGVYYKPFISKLFPLVSTVAPLITFALVGLTVPLFVSLLANVIAYTVTFVLAASESV